MTKACLAFAFFCFGWALPLQAFEWESITSNGREYVTLQSFCTFYGFAYQVPSGNDYFQSRNPQHTIRLKVGTSDMYLDGVHYVLSFPVQNGDRDWLISRMDVIKLFEPVLRPTEIAGRHSIRGVVIDAGHGGSDNGAVSARGGMEKDYTRDTAFRLESLLRGQGLKTVLTRRSDVFVDLYERAHVASLYPDYAFVSIHFNSATPEARGLETYCLSPRGAASTSSAYLTRSDIQKLPGNDYDPANILLASMVHSEIIKLNPGDVTADRGIKRARFVVIKQNVLPAILVEGGFVSNRMEAAQINTTGYRQRLSEAIARGVIKFVNVMGGKKMPMPKSSPDESPVPPSPKTIVQAPPAPSGLARDTTISKKSGKTVTSSDTAPKPADASAASPAPKTKKSKMKKAVVTTVPSPATNVSANSSATVHPDGQTPAAPLNLSEPATPTPSAGADKASVEPDEPPVVNIYSTAPAKSSGTSESVSPAVSTSPPISRTPKSNTNTINQPTMPPADNP
jgi:N-acetylmuramoyl-L-alanine amidase